MKDVFATQKKIFIVLELVEGGELFDKIASEGRFTEDKARFYFKQLVEGTCGLLFISLLQFLADFMVNVIVLCCRHGLLSLAGYLPQRSKAGESASGL